MDTQQPITRFSELNIQQENSLFVGKSIEMEELIGTEIILHDYKIGPSKFTDRGSGKCLTMQIEVDKVKRVAFSGSTNLMAMAEKIGRNQLPVATTIIKEKESKRLLFT